MRAVVVKEHGMTPAQCRAARAWLKLKQDDLAEAAGVSNSTVRDYEAGRRTPIGNNLAAMRKALEGKGIAFDTNSISGPPVDGPLTG